MWDLLKSRKFWSWDILEPVFKLGFLLLGVIVVFIAFKNNLIFSRSLQTMGNFQYRFFTILFMLSFIIFVSSLVFRTILWFQYRNYDLRKVKIWPEVTIVVPAYNEGATVLQTIHSIARCDYPRKKLRVITINDGSRDDTLQYQLQAQAAFPELVQVIDFKTNRGKRQAIYQAYQQTQADFLLTIDSDTKLEPNAIKEIVTPMILNKKIAAVTGRIRVWNRNTNVMTKMLNAHFAMAFDFTRAIQSTFDCVFCLAGAFSAYRVSALRKVMEPWIRQKFLNVPCTYGEDRSLTNHILREGYASFFQRSAVCFTMVPVTMGKILKMFTRWARSNIRESIIFARLVFHPNRRGNMLLPFLDFFMTVSLLIIHFIWFYYFLFAGFLNVGFFFRVISYSFLFGFFYSLYYIRIEGKSDSPYIIAFSLFSSVFMIWIFTVAGLTLTKTSWSTR